MLDDMFLLDVFEIDYPKLYWEGHPKKAPCYTPFGHFLTSITNFILKLSYDSKII